MAGETRSPVSRGFDRLAPIYDLLAAVGMGGQIHRSQVALLPRIPRASRALIVGGGTGRFLAEALQRGHIEHAVSIDSSAAMTRATDRRLRRLGLSARAELRHGSLERLGPLERFDLVVTHCFLDLFDEQELPGVVSRLADGLPPGGHWLFSDFAAGGGGASGTARRAIVGSLYSFFRLTCNIKARRLPDFDAVLTREGLDPVAKEAFAAGLLRAELLVKRPALGVGFLKRQVSFL